MKKFLVFLLLVLFWNTSSFSKDLYEYLKSDQPPPLILGHTDFDKALNNVLLNLAKRVVSDGEGASKFITINVSKCKNEIDAKKIALSVANSPLVKTAISGEDPNWGRVIMAIGKAGPKINLKKLSVKFGNIAIVEGGKLNQSYDEKQTANYMKSENIEINIETFTGNKNFTVYTMDFTKKYIEINADYRSWLIENLNWMIN